MNIPKINNIVYTYDIACLLDVDRRFDTVVRAKREREETARKNVPLTMTERVNSRAHRITIVSSQKIKKLPKKNGSSTNASHRHHCLPCIGNCPDWTHLLSAIRWETEQGRCCVSCVNAPDLPH